MQCLWTAFVSMVASSMAAESWSFSWSTTLVQAEISQMFMDSRGWNQLTLVTFHLAPAWGSPLCEISQQTYSSIDWHYAQMFALLRINCNNSIDLLSLYLPPPSGEHFNLTYTSVYIQTPARSTISPPSWAVIRLILGDISNKLAFSSMHY